MNSMASRRVLQLGEGEGARAVVVRELTLGEFRAWLKQAAENPLTDIVTTLLFESFDAADLLRFTDLSVEALEAMTPSQMREVWRVVQEVNSDFFAMLGRVTGRASQSSVSGKTWSAQG